VTPPSFCFLRLNFALPFLFCFGSRKFYVKAPLQIYQPICDPPLVQVPVCQHLPPLFGWPGDPPWFYEPLLIVVSPSCAPCFSFQVAPLLHVHFFLRISSPSNSPPGVFFLRVFLKFPLSRLLRCPGLPSTSASIFRIFVNLGWRLPFCGYPPPPVEPLRRFLHPFP